MTDQHEHHNDEVGDCADALAEIYTFLDGELTDERRQLIGVHLDDCNPCLEIFDFEAELRLVVQQRCRDQVPDDLRRRIEERLRELGVVEGGGGPSVTPSN